MTIFKNIIFIIAQIISLSFISCTKEKRLGNNDEIIVSFLDTTSNTTITNLDFVLFDGSVEYELNELFVDEFKNRYKDNNGQIRLDLPSIKKQFGTKSKLYFKAKKDYMLFNGQLLVIPHDTIYRVTTTIPRGKLIK